MEIIAPAGLQASSGSAAAVGREPATPRRVEVERLGRASWDRVLPTWRALQRQCAPDDLDADPDWCRGLEDVYPGRVQLITLRENGVLTAVQPITLMPAEINCHLGELNVMQFRPRVITLLGAEPTLPPSTRAYTALFSSLAAWHREFDAVRFTARLDSPLWNYLAGPQFGAFGLRRFAAMPVAAAHHLIRMPKTMDDYLAKFTAKTRKNRLREIKQLGQRGAVELTRISAVDQIDMFLRQADAISRSSYQHRLLGAGLRAPDKLRRRLHVAAERGWLRSYLLSCGGMPCSFMLGYQYRGRYHYTKVGYDPQWTGHSVGTVLQLLVLQDMFAHDPPEIFDFGSNGAQKQYFGNERFEEGTAYFFNRGLYPWLVRASCRYSSELSRRGGKVLERWHLKGTMQRWLRKAKRV